MFSIFAVQKIDSPNPIPMMNRKTGLLVSLVLICSGLLAQQRSYEGMWLPYKAPQNNHADMKATGFTLPAEMVYNEDAPSLEDAIVRLNDGMCTAELISGEGLVLTNHHCAYDGVADLSSVDFDILTDGFWAKSRAEEIPIPGFTAAFLVKSRDVTAELNAAEDMEQAMEAMVEEAEEEGKYSAVIKEMFGGSELNLFVYKVYRDVRLVGVPPSSIGKFGGDTDNWVWPRHTGDFAMIRIYADASNEPADYSESNVPYKPKFFLPISLKGVEENDYAMVMGYPGSTERYLTSSAVQMLLDQTNDDRILLLGEKTRTMKKFMDQDPKIRIALASEYASLMNYYKYLIGQTTMMKRYDVPAIKAEKEKAFREWANANPERKNTYGSVLDDMASLLQENKELDKAVSYTYFGPLAADAILNARSWVGFALAPESRFPALVERIRPGLDEGFEAFFPEVDKEILYNGILLYVKNVPEQFQAPVVMEMLNPAPPAPAEEETGKKKKKKKKAVEIVVPAVELTLEQKVQAYVDRAYATSVVTDKARAEAFLNAPSKEIAANDPIIKMTLGVLMFFQQNVGQQQAAYEGGKLELEKTYIAGLREMNPDKAFYPDANSTMRLTYGKVLPYSPRDGVAYDHITTADGILEKEDPTSDEFNVPAKLKELIEKKDFGPYGKDGELVVCFLSTTDITGGNSGSPVINGNGELIGCAFDGNWEAMSSDVIVFPQFNRTIAVDARYILFVVDKFAGAGYLLNEMKIVR